MTDTEQTEIDRLQAIVDKLLEACQETTKAWSEAEKKKAVKKCFAAIAYYNEKLRVKGSF